MRPTFNTKRMSVFQVKASPLNGCEPRTIFLGFFSDQDYPSPVTMATVDARPDAIKNMGGAYLDWIWTHELFRRRGLARELCEAIEGRLECALVISGVTPDGEAFEEAMAERYMERETPKVGKS